MAAEIETESALLFLSSLFVAVYSLFSDVRKVTIFSSFCIDHHLIFDYLLFQSLFSSPLSTRWRIPPPGTSSSSSSSSTTTATETTDDTYTKNNDNHNNHNQNFHKRRKLSYLSATFCTTTTTTLIFFTVILLSNLFGK